MFDFSQHFIQDIESCHRGRQNRGNRFDIESARENFWKPVYFVVMEANGRMKSGNSWNLESPTDGFDD
jgi:hypothetical protein